MKIAIDARFWGPSHTGLGVYTRELVTNLQKIDQENKYVLLVRPDFDTAEIIGKNFSVIKVDAPPYTVKEQLLLSLVLLKVNPDLAHFPSINVPILFFKRIVVTIHDLIKHKSRGVETSTLPRPIYWFKYFIYRLLIYWLTIRAAKIIAPSNAVASDLKKTYPVTARKTVVTYEASTINPSLKKASVALPQKFAIYTGNAYPHKNLPFLISAWEEVFQKTKTKLVLVCGRSVFAKKIEHLVEQMSAASWVEFKGYLTDEQLAFSYGKATLYVFPTLMEGFGIPGLDAMDCSLPLLCSRLPVLEEVYGDAATYFDPYNKADLVEKAVRLIESSDRRRQQIEAGKKRVKMFSWMNLAQGTLDVYKEAVSS